MKPLNLILCLLAIALAGLFCLFSVDAGVDITSGGGGGADGVGATVFTELGDVPGSYSGESGKVVRVNDAEDGLEFYEITAIGNGYDCVIGNPDSGFYMVVVGGMVSNATYNLNLFTSGALTGLVATVPGETNSGKYLSQAGTWETVPAGTGGNSYTNSVGTAGGFSIVVEGGLVTDLSYSPVLFSGPGTGLVASATADTNKFLRGDGTWQQVNLGQTHWGTNFYYTSISTTVYPTNKYYMPFNPSGVVVSVGNVTNQAWGTQQANQWPNAWARVHASNEVWVLIGNNTGPTHLTSNTTAEVYLHIWQ